MGELLTAAQMRAVEVAAMASGAVTGLELMERAGRGVVGTAFARWPELAVAPRRGLVLAGPGNNGGDGYVVARLLREWGWEVEVFALGEPERLKGDAQANHARWREMGGAVRPLAELGAGLEESPAVVIDALFGTGLARPLTGSVAEAIRAVAAWRGEGGRDGRVVAVDIPSGICADSGRVLGAAMHCDLTVSFHAPKLGHYLAEGPAHAGWLEVADIGIGAWAAGAGECVQLVELTAPVRELAKTGGHKYHHGHALVLSGGVGRGGAARMAARAALRVGAGLVTLGCPPAAMIENAARLEAVMLRPVADGEALAALLEDPRIDALCLGPGLGLGPREGALVAAALDAGRATVLDADALTILAREPRLRARVHGRCVLTPHEGEFARLFPGLGARLRAEPEAGPAFSRLDAARAAARESGAVVLLKGPDTVIAAPDGRAWVHAAAYARAAPWLATAGAGDVLAGLIAGLLARGLAPERAASLAAWLHVEAARRAGAGMIAEDLPDRLPEVFSALGL
ncbi:yjeF C-terminal region, hydroxyethylthiazole kinase-related/yjeF N-terminal region [Meinhardsimonia xiamenensis]|jgi:hydroxyethylthiazole kinase-like uncharacterized protein yjeF|uniref:Bifunctional NAD(P)H-hydrate repair enzyme n=1 Tax=Meinhardsimonia xiamenensis TaxID=990712 RepID=A0A1G9AEP4_9RHOB|nr:NAD(P)H-hydrate dehydratase [Meinhardsimonia xiamenensis]PRX35412.1 hydroxyethylthiazole kinase-like uncharacterized protein yjeF/hydroxyethylthiazole kinase-like uncharacterized protein yjeF [Meinhardsimonia xiamenensis]SDK25837.1 yjeF C-terminal region, hydroxyethylthiazole kinase-related/yjeF N-terminal region [Meinhardsimonia xiamenensis]